MKVKLNYNKKLFDFKKMQKYFKTNLSNMCILKKFV